MNEPPNTAGQASTGSDRPSELTRWCLELAGLDAAAVVEWACARFGERLVVSTSFGIQSAVVLHLVTSVRSDVAVIWVDTGYLPAETYRYADELARRLALNLHVARSAMSPAQMEAVHGRLWEKGDVASLDLYHRIRKVEPMKNALDVLGAEAWIAGLRAEQTAHRGTLPVLGKQWARYKILPVLDWSTERVHAYLRDHRLPLHPLHEQGYTTVGDWHSSGPAHGQHEHERETRFRGLKQECGLHLPEPA